MNTTSKRASTHDDIDDDIDQVDHTSVMSVGSRAECRHGWIFGSPVRPNSRSV